MFVYSVRVFKSNSLPSRVLKCGRNIFKFLLELLERLTSQTRDVSFRSTIEWYVLRLKIQPTLFLPVRDYEYTAAITPRMMHDKRSQEFMRAMGVLTWSNHPRETGKNSESPATKCCGILKRKYVSVNSHYRPYSYNAWMVHRPIVNPAVERREEKLIFSRQKKHRFAYLYPFDNREDIRIFHKL